VLNLEQRLSCDGDSVREGHADRAVAGNHLIGDGNGSRTRRDTGSCPSTKKPSPGGFPDRHGDRVADPDLRVGRLAVLPKPVLEALGRLRQECRDDVVVHVDNVKARLVVLDCLVHNLTGGWPCGRQCRAPAERGAS
jgi:hypothetical protein